MCWDHLIDAEEEVKPEAKQPAPPIKQPASEEPLEAPAVVEVAS